MSGLTWAAAWRVDRSVDIGSVALRLAAYQRDGLPVLAPIAGLRVVDEASAGAGRWHESTGVYGFLDLPPGPRRFVISDPAGRWLDREVSVAAPDRSALRTALLAGAPPPVDAGPLWQDVAMYITAQQPIPSGNTVVWGVVSRGTAVVPSAFVSLTFVAQAGVRVYRGAANAQGVYALWLRGLSFDDDTEPPTPPTLQAFAPRAGADVRLPAAFDGLIPGTPAFSALYQAPGVSRIGLLPLGARTRVDLTLP